MKPVSTFAVTPSIPERLKHLKEIAYNLHWSWDYDSVELFRRLDRNLWETTQHNPVLLLSQIDQKRLNEFAEDEAYSAHYDNVWKNLQNYMENQNTWFKKRYKEKNPVIAYFSAEFGITESLAIYSGGLGMLAGDHLKSASELGLPLIGVGLLYQEGYFRQYLNEDGWQQESYPENDFYNIPITLLHKDDGKPYIIDVTLAGKKIYARIWKAQVGRVSLYLLDTNFDMNSQEDQDIVDQLYGGDNEMRIKQEIILGIGGIRALNALGIEPDICHMNEGHSAFLALERIRLLMQEKKLSFEEAREVSAGGNVFTTHTPVEAGHDHFEPWLVNKYFADYRKELNLNENQFLALGHSRAGDESQLFSMTILAAYLSSCRNGVSKLHGKVTKKMWSKYWQNIPWQEIPVEFVTNGIHPSSWLSKEIAYLFDQYLGPRWVRRADDQSIWKGVKDIPSIELWNTHRLRKQRLIAFARKRLKEQLIRRGGSVVEIERADEVLDPNVLTIGFARRFATYKRAYLIFRDEERIIKLLADPEKPIQIIFAGKAHPRDHAGKEIIKTIVHYAHRPELRNRLVFLEDYDMDVARYLVKGVDVWLNTPIRPREASGTSGMKAAFNGAINVSILDGWWDEAYTPDIGWAIGRGEDYDNRELQDEVEANNLYELLENEVIPAFYERGRDNIPRKWVALMKNTMTAICPYFNTNRMVQEYTDSFYMPSADRLNKITADNFEGAKILSSWKKKIQDNFGKIKISNIKVQKNDELVVGDKVTVSAEVNLDGLSPEDVHVEFYWGKVDVKKQFVNPEISRMEHYKDLGQNKHIFQAEEVAVSGSGLHGYTVRVKPYSELIETVYHFELLNAMKWAS